MEILQVSEDTRFASDSSRTTLSGAFDSRALLASRPRHFLLMLIRNEALLELNFCSNKQQQNTHGKSDASQMQRESHAIVGQAGADLWLFQIACIEFQWNKLVMQ